MSPFEERLRVDLTRAMRARDELRMATLRMALAAVTAEAVAGKTARELSDADIEVVLTREAKKRREAAAAFDGAGRAELAARERAEGDVLAGYLPKQLSDAELTGLVRRAVAEVGANDVRQLGAVMKVVSPRVTGRAEGGRVAAEVRAQLS